jgi:hypothetical protein
MKRVSRFSSEGASYRRRFLKQFVGVLWRERSYGIRVTTSSARPDALLLRMQRKDVCLEVSDGFKREKQNGAMGDWSHLERG